LSTLHSPKAGPGHNHEQWSKGRLDDFIKTKTTWFLGVPRPHEAEARGLKEAIKWLGSMRLSKVSIKLSCKQVVDGIARRLNINSMIGAILDIYKDSLRIHKNFKISFIRRQANNVTHLLANVSLSYSSFHIQDHMLSCIKTVIINEMS